MVLIAKTQQLPLYSQYMFNKMLLNPGATGSEKNLPVQLAIRQQWVGFEDAPSTQVLNAQYCLEDYNMGVGAILYVDRFGPEQKLGFQLNYSYILKLGDELKLGLGLSLQGFQYRLDYTKLNVIDQSDPNIFDAKETKFVPESDFGLFLYHKNYFAGISGNQLIGLPIVVGGQEIHIAKLVRHFNFLGGYKFKLNNDFDLEPSMLIKSSFKAPHQLDFNLKTIFQNNYWLGFSYRTSNDIIAILGLNFKEFDLGFAVDFVTSDIAAYQNGSYELFITYKIPVSNKRRGKSML